MPLRDPDAPPDAGINIPGKPLDIVRAPAVFRAPHRIPAGAIVNQPGGQLVNHSGIASFNRLSSMPAWKEVEGYREHFSPSDQYAVRFFEGPWFQRKAFYDAMLGYPQDGSGTDRPLGIVRAIPANHPEHTWLYAVDCELVEGKGAITEGDNGLIQYVNMDPAMAADFPGVAKVKVTYRPLDYDVRTDTELESHFDGNELYRYVTRNWTYAIKSLPVPTRTHLRFAEGPAGVITRPIDAAQAQFILSTREVTYTWHQVPDVPQSNIDDCLGKVNEGAFDAPKKIDGFSVSGYGSETDGYEAQTLLFLTPQIARQRSIAGRVTFSIIYKFLYQPQGWNKFPALSSGALTFLLATFDGTVTGKTVYSTADFEKLFRLPSAFGRYQNADG